MILLTTGKVVGVCGTGTDRDTDGGVIDHLFLITFDVGLVLAGEVEPRDLGELLVLFARGGTALSFIDRDPAPAA